jgi:hypothetical protein
LADYLFLADETFCLIETRLNTIKFIPNPTGKTKGWLELLSVRWLLRHQPMLARFMHATQKSDKLMVSDNAYRTKSSQNFVPMMITQQQCHMFQSQNRSGTQEKTFFS